MEEKKNQTKELLFSFHIIRHLWTIICRRLYIIVYNLKVNKFIKIKNKSYYGFWFIGKRTMVTILT